MHGELNISEDNILILNSSSTDLFRSTLTFAMSYILDNKNYSEILSQHEQSIIEAKELERFQILFSTLYVLINDLVRHKVKPQSIHDELLKYHMPGHFIEEIINTIRIYRVKIEMSRIERPIGFPRLTKFTWRINMKMSSNLLSRIMKSCISMRMFFTGGDVRTFECSVEKFQSLRYDIAKALNEIQKLERHPMMRIVDEFERRDKEERMA